MFRKRIQPMVGFISEEGYLLYPYIHADAKPEEVEIVPYNCISCHIYEYKYKPGGVAGGAYNPNVAHCITDDLESCFTYAEEHGLNVVRVKTLDGISVWKKNTKAVKEELEIKITLYNKIISIWPDCPLHLINNKENWCELQTLLDKYDSLKEDKNE